VTSGARNTRHALQLGVVPLTMVGALLPHTARVGTLASGLLSLAFKGVPERRGACLARGGIRNGN